MRAIIKKIPALTETKFIIFIIFISLIPFYRINFGLLPLFGADVYTDHIYWRYFLCDEVFKNFSFPLWNPYIFNGVPLFGNPQSSVFYPFTYLLCIIPRENQYGFYTMLHIMLGVIFMSILLIKGMGLSPLSSIIGIITFILYPYFWYRINDGWLPFLQSYIWIPLIMYYYLSSLKQRRYFIHTSFAMTLQFLGGDPQASYATNLFLGIFTIFMIVIDLKEKRVTDAKYKAKIYFLTIIFFFLLSSIQFLPAVEFTKYSWRSGGVGYHEFFSSSFDPGLALALLLMFAIPGIIPCFLIILSRKFLEIKMVYIYLILYLFFLFLTAGSGTALYEPLYYYLPGLKYFKEPDEFYTICNFILASLASISFEKLRRADISRLKRAILYSSVAVHFLLLFISSVRFIQPFDFDSNFSIYKKIAQATLSKDPLDRVVILGKIIYRPTTSIPGNSVVLFNRENVFGYDPLAPEFVIKLVYEYSQIPVVTFMKTLGARFLFTNAYIKSDILQLIYSDEFYIYRLTEDTKRFYIARNLIPDEGLSLAEFLRDGTIEKEGKAVVGETILNELASRITSEKEKEEEDDTIRLIDYRPNQITLRVYMKSPGILVIKNNYYPGWKARIDEESVPVFKTNLIFQGVFLPAGVHTVKLKFMPLSFQTGAVLSAISLLILAFLLTSSTTHSVSYDSPI